MFRLPEWAKKREELKLPYIERVWRRLFQKSEIKYIDSVSFTENMLNTEKRETPVIFSLTSFPDRIDSVHYAVKSLMLQSFKADMIILWLASQQFPDRQLPNSLTELQKYGLTVRFCDEDLKAHKKYYYAMQEFCDSIIITFDDDIIYGKGVVSRLMEKHKSYPDCIVSDSARLMKLDENGNIIPYVKWLRVTSEGVDKPSMKLMALTGSGCLYPSGIMPESTFDKALLKELSFSADDLWMKYNELLYDIPVIKAYKNHRIFINSECAGSASLSDINWNEGGNDKIINAMLSRNPELKQKLI